MPFTHERNQANDTFTVLVCELDGLHKAEDLFHVAANGKVIHMSHSDNALGIDDEQSSDQSHGIITRTRMVKARPKAPQRHTLGLEQDTVVFGDGSREIRHCKDMCSAWLSA